SGTGGEVNGKELFGAGKGRLLAHQAPVQVQDEVVGGAPVLRQPAHDLRWRVRFLESTVETRVDVIFCGQRHKATLHRLCCAEMGMAVGGLPAGAVSPVPCEGSDRRLGCRLWLNPSLRDGAITLGRHPQLTSLLYRLQYSRQEVARKGPITISILRRTLIYF